MQKIFRYTSMFILFLMLLPASFTHANTTEEESTEASAELPEDGASTEEYYNEPTEEITEEPTYEPTTEEPYRTFEVPTEEYYEPVEPSIEETVEAPTEEVTEELTEEPVEAPTEEVFVEPETVEEPREVRINQAEATDFSVRGKVISDNKGLEGMAVNLTGDKEDSVETDGEGNFVFSEVPSGEYDIQVEVPDGYSAEQDTFSVAVEDRGKRGITFVMEEEPVEEEVEALETDEQAAGHENNSVFDRNIALIVFGSILLVLGFIIFLMRARKG